DRTVTGVQTCALPIFQGRCYVARMCLTDSLNVAAEDRAPNLDPRPRAATAARNTAAAELAVIVVIDRDFQHAGPLRLEVDRHQRSTATEVQHRPRERLDQEPVWPEPPPEERPATSASRRVRRQPEVEASDIALNAAALLRAIGG